MHNHRIMCHILQCNAEFCIAGSRLETLLSFRRFLVLFLLSISFAAPRAAAQSNQPNDPSIAAGHSMHGEAFNEGPRQKAELMKGMGNVKFPVTTRNPLAQKFFNQGVAQLHGFWYFEAERSFRQAALLDPDCAMAYWGMAMANTQNARRAKGLIKEAVQRRAKAGAREQMWIDSLAEFYADEKKDKRAREKDLAAKLEAIFKKYPEDIEAKAFYSLIMWERGNLTAAERETVDKTLNEVLAVEPLHPCHHYRIHLWNYNKDENALNSAARGGQSAPGIAHLWHMPGHTYSQLKQYDQAAWQQEASARVDHAHMMRYRLLPDQIHNFAHNNEWLIRNLSFLGRVHDAVDLAKNMVELPRHPQYNSDKDWRSAKYGRHRLIELLERYELWDKAIELANSPYIEPGDKPESQIQRLSLLGLAYLQSGKLAQGKATIAEVDKLRQSLVEKQEAAEANAEADARKEGKSEDDVSKAKTAAGRGFKNDIDAAVKSVRELTAHLALAERNLPDAKKLFGEVKGIPRERMSRIHLALGDKESAEKDALQAAKDGKNEVQPLANLVYVLEQCGKRPEAEEKFSELRKLAAHADLDTPVMRRLKPLAASLHLSEDWRLPIEPRTDTGIRPSLDSLGPFRWRPLPAHSWSLRDASGKRISLAGYRGRPVIVIFFLGNACRHCMEQLNLFAPAADRFKSMGIDLVAISTDTSEGLRKTLMFDGKGSPFPFPIVSDAKLETFKKYRCYDDFEKTPLHGSFLIDADGLVRWHDISYQPFTEIEFLINESKRLLSQGMKAVHSARQSAKKSTAEPADSRPSILQD